MKSTTFQFVAIISSTAAFFERSYSDPVELDFGYDALSLKGPNLWRDVNVTGHEWEQYVGLGFIDLDVPKNECKSTRRPSPINLVSNAECLDEHEILTRRIAPTDCKMNSLEFKITAHNLRATFPNNDVSCERPTIDLPNGYPFRWFAHHIEIHVRAEHVLDGRRYDGEMQMYHLGQEDQRREMASVSVMLDASGFKDNPKLQEYIDRWLQVEQQAKGLCENGRRLQRKPTTTLSGPRFEKSVNYTVYPRALDHPEHASTDSRRLEQRAFRDHMFPYDIWPTIYYYRYKGSFTVPPCSEIVSWRVLDEPLIISRRQLQTMLRLMKDYVDPTTCQTATRVSSTGENFRPLQQHNHEKQELVHCTEKHFGRQLYPVSIA